MRRISDERLIRRNARLGKAFSLVGMAVLLGGLVFSLRFPEQGTVPFATLIVGFLLANVGIHFSSRWVRPPRPDQALDAALKGLDDRYSLYHYRLGASHVFVSPGGTFAIVPKRQPGLVRYSSGRWHHRGGNFFLKIFGQEALGNPSMEAAAEAKSASSRLAKLLPDENLPQVTPIIVFTDDSVSLEVEAPPYPTLHAKKLKEYIRRLPKAPTLSRAQLGALDQKLGVSETGETAKA